MPSNHLYYYIKPYIPRRLRMALRRVLARRRREIYKDVWPINEAAGQPPEEWSGWPDNKQFAFVLTHDVEGRKGLERCRQLMALEMEMGFRSSFNFIPEGDYAVPRELRDELKQNGFEIGVHDLKHDGKLYASRETFRESAARINKYLSEWNAVGFRSGFMLNNLDWLRDLNIHYDASTFECDPFEPQPDGVGTVFPFLVTRPDGTTYVELPYTLPQDSTLFNLLQETTIETWEKKLRWIVERGGMALVDTHPDYMSFSGPRDGITEFPVSYYKEFLHHVKSAYRGLYWHALPSQVAAHVQENRKSARAHSNILALETGPAFRGKKNLIASNGPALQTRKAIQQQNDSSTETSRKINAQNEQHTDSQTSAASIGGGRWRLRGKRAAMVLFSHYPADPRPRRAAEILAKAGTNVDLICLRGNPEELDRETINGVNVSRISLKRRRGGKLTYVIQYSAFIFSSFILLAFRSLFHRYDLIYVHNMPDVLVFSALIPKMMGAKVVLDLHDPMPELMLTIFKLPPESSIVRLLKRLEKRSIRFADLVVTVNKASHKIYSSRSCLAEKILIVMNSPDERIFKFQLPISQSSEEKEIEKPFVIMYHGSLVPRNGFDLAVDALEIVRRSIPAAKLVVCGESTAFFESVMKSVHERGLEKFVHYLGAQNQKQIVNAIDECDIGVIPNHRNLFTEMNTPTRIFEYLARGKPVIAPHAQGIEDYFGGEDLIYFELGNATDLARKIEYAFFHPEEVKKTVQLGQDVYLAHTWSRESSGLVDAISHLLEPASQMPINFGRFYSEYHEEVCRG